jgi:hypothetical protein
MRNITASLRSRTFFAKALVTRHSSLHTSHSPEKYLQLSMRRRMSKFIEPFLFGELFGRPHMPTLSMAKCPIWRGAKQEDVRCRLLGTI